MRERLLERIGIQTKPNLVEKASRRERWKRQTWAFVSLVLSATVVGVPISAMIEWLNWTPRGAASAWPVFVFVLLVVVVQGKIFNWGFERFDLVAPWQFREERAKEWDQP